MTRFVKCVTAMLLAVLATACGSGSNNTANANLRFVNATQSATLSVSLNGVAQFSGVTAGNASGYAAVTPSTYTIEVTSANAALTASPQIQGLASGQTYTLLAYERNGAIIAVLLVEAQVAPTSGLSTVAVSNSSLDAGTLDVYVVTPGTTNLTGLTPAFQQVVFGAFPIGVQMTAGTYDIVATATGNPNDVRSRLSNVAVGGGQVLMVAYTSTSGGSLLNAALLTQGGAPVKIVPTTLARVRVVSTLPSSATPVVATIGTTTLPNVFSLPLVGAYTLVPGGSTTYSITAGGTAIPSASLPAATFATGGDFTILVYGSASSPSVAVFTDNNQAPGGGLAGLRLVNAAVAAQLTLAYNSLQAPTSAGLGQASQYFEVNALAAPTMAILESQVSPAPVPQTAITTNGVYTIFVFDTALHSVVIRDR